MKLRNKKTGEVYNACRIIFGESIEGLKKNQWKTLVEFNEDWEDYEEPKNQYYLDCDGRIFEHHTTEYIKNKMKEIGNYFETKEEAEKTVEKLKAWKRLKDKGFRFNPEASYIEQMGETEGSMMFIACTMNDYRDFVFGDNTDIKLLFGDNK